MLAAALSRLLPRALQKKVGTTSDVESRTSHDITSRPSSCRVVLLDDTEIEIDIPVVNMKGRELLDQVFSHVNIVEKDYFGVCYQDEANKMVWLDGKKPVAAQLRSLPMPRRLHFGVKFYAADPCKLFEEITRYQFFLQTKRDIAEGRLLVDTELGAELAAYAVQSELGDYDGDVHLPGYTSEFDLMPDQTEEFEERVAVLHRRLTGQVPARAEYNYLDRVRWLDMYGVVLHPVKGDGGIEYLLGIAPTGIVIYRNKTKIVSHFWPRIVKISCKGRHFVIRVRDKTNVENTCTFDCVHKQAAKQLSKCCLEHLTFYRRISASHSYEASSRLFSAGSKFAQSLDISADSTQSSFVRRLSRRRRRRMSACSDSQCDSFMSTTTRGAASMFDGSFRGQYDGCESPTSVRSEFVPRRGYDGQLVGRTRQRRRGERCYVERGGNAGSMMSVASHRYTRHRDRCRRRSVANGGDVWADGADDGLSIISSMMSVASAPDSHRAHRRRRRSSGVRPPKELAEHFRYAEGDDEFSEGLLHYVPYTCVSSEFEGMDDLRQVRRRSRSRSSHRRYRDDEDADQWKAWSATDDEAPPPYVEPLSRYGYERRSVDFERLKTAQQQRLVVSSPSSQVHKPMAVHVTEIHMAPIVKIKALYDTSTPTSSNSPAARDADTPPAARDTPRARDDTVPRDSLQSALDNLHTSTYEVIEARRSQSPDEPGLVDHTATARWSDVPASTVAASTGQNLASRAADPADGMGGSVNGIAAVTSGSQRPTMVDAGLNQWPAMNSDRHAGIDRQIERNRERGRAREVVDWRNRRDAGWLQAEHRMHRRVYNHEVDFPDDDGSSGQRHFVHYVPPAYRQATHSRPGGWPDPFAAHSYEYSYRPSAVTGQTVDL